MRISDWSADVCSSDLEVKAYLPATWRYNASVGYRINDRARVSLAVNNLTNAMPPRDFSNIDYPFYNFNWYDTIGRAYYLNFTWKFGGEPLSLPIRILGKRSEERRVGKECVRTCRYR